MSFSLAAAEAEKEEEQLKGRATTTVGGVTQSEGDLTTEKGRVIQSECGPFETQGLVKLTPEVESPCEAPTSEGEHPAELLHDAVSPEFTAGNDVITRELLATSVTKHRAHRRHVQDVGATRADENLLSQEMFVSIEGNQFRRNGMGSFGTFLY